jgi:hypothetical protein
VHPPNSAAGQQDPEVDILLVTQGTEGREQGGHSRGDGDWDHQGIKGGIPVGRAGSAGGGGGAHRRHWHSFAGHPGDDSSHSFLAGIPEGTSPPRSLNHTSLNHTVTLGTSPAATASSSSPLLTRDIPPSHLSNGNHGSRGVEHAVAQPAPAAGQHAGAGSTAGIARLCGFAPSPVAEPLEVPGRSSSNTMSPSSGTSSARPNATPPVGVSAGSTRVFPVSKHRASPTRSSYDGTEHFTAARAGGTPSGAAHHKQHTWQTPVGGQQGFSARPSSTTPGSVTKSSAVLSPLTSGSPPAERTSAGKPGGVLKYKAPPAGLLSAAIAGSSPNNNNAPATPATGAAGSLLVGGPTPGTPAAAAGLADHPLEAQAQSVAAESLAMAAAALEAASAALVQVQPPSSTSPAPAPTISAATLRQQASQLRAQATALGASHQGMPVPGVAAAAGALATTGTPAADSAAPHPILRALLSAERWSGAGAAPAQPPAPEAEPVARPQPTAVLPGSSFDSEEATASAVLRSAPCLPPGVQPTASFIGPTLPVLETPPSVAAEHRVAKEAARQMRPRGGTLSGTTLFAPGPAAGATGGGGLPPSRHPTAAVPGVSPSATPVAGLVPRGGSGEADITGVGPTEEAGGARSFFALSHVEEDEEEEHGVHAGPDVENGKPVTTRAATSPFAARHVQQPPGSL